MRNITSAAHVGAEVVRSAAFIGFILAIGKASPRTNAAAGAVALACTSAATQALTMAAAVCWLAAALPPIQIERSVGLRRAGMVCGAVSVAPLVVHVSVLGRGQW